MPCFMVYRGVRWNVTMRPGDSEHHTDRLILRAPKETDIDALYAIQGDRRHMQHTFWAESRAACAEWLGRYSASRAVNGFAPWTLVQRADGQIVGWGGLSVDPAVPGWGPEVSYFIHQAHGGRGLATELVRATLHHTFDDLRLASVAAFARPQNDASIRVLEKCGFRFVRYEPPLSRNHYSVLPT